MARIRTIKPEFWTSGQILECSRDARLLFIGLWNFCDDAGRHPLRPKQIKAELFPADDDITSENVRGMLDELSTNALIEVYEVDGEQYFEITGWKKHQRIDRPHPGKYPPPIQEDINNSTNDPRAIDERSIPIGKDTNGKESKRKDTNGEEMIGGDRGGKKGGTNRASSSALRGTPTPSVNSEQVSLQGRGQARASLQDFYRRNGLDAQGKRIAS